jgi:transposase
MIKKEKIELTMKQDIFVGIDISGRKHRARFIDKMGREKAAPISFSNDVEGLKKMENHLKGIRGIGHNVMFGVEPSGDYWKPIAYYLKKEGYPVVLVNPYHLRSTKEIIDNSQEKDDNKDSYLIADLIKQGKYFFPIMPEGIYGELRELSNIWEKTSKELAIKKCYLANFLAKYFPEYRENFTDVLGKTSFYILKHFPLPEDITKIGKKRFSRLIKRVSRGRIGQYKIEMIYEKAEKSIGIKEGSQVAKNFLKGILADIERLKERKEEIKKVMEYFLGQTGYKENLLSIPGVGIVTASIFLGQIGDVSNYRRSREIEKLAGLNLVENSSGGRKGDRKISKRGRNMLRYVGYLVATVGISKNPEIKSLYWYKVMECKKEKMKVLTSIAAKMLRIMFIVCKKKVYYDAEEIRKYFNNRGKIGGVRSGSLHQAPYSGDTGN